MLKTGSCGSPVPVSAAGKVQVQVRVLQRAAVVHLSCNYVKSRAKSPNQTTRAHRPKEFVCSCNQAPSLCSIAITAGPFDAEEQALPSPLLALQFILFALRCAMAGTKLTAAFVALHKLGAAAFFPASQIGVIETKVEG